MNPPASLAPPPRPSPSPAGSASVAAGPAGRPWLDHYPDGVPHDIEPAGSLADLIRHACERHAARPAFQSFGARLTYSEVLGNALAVAAWLRARGLQPGDRVALMMPNIMAYPVVMFGALLGGFTVVNVNPLYTEHELALQLTDSGARILFAFDGVADVALAARARARCVEAIVLCRPGDLLGIRGVAINAASRGLRRRSTPAGRPSAMSLRAVLASGDDGVRPGISPEDVAFLQYTGGTTGVPKGAVLLHRNLVANAMQCGAWFAASIARNPRPPVMLAALPLFHVFGLTGCCLQMLRFGAMSLLVANPRDTAGLLRSLRRTPVTMMIGVNTLYASMIERDDFARVDWSGLSFAIAGGAALQSGTARRWLALTGKAITEGYGLTETSCVLTIDDVDAPSTGTIGYPAPSTHIALRDGDRDVAPGEPGELLARGPQVMRGYWGREEDTVAAFSADGFLRTGDVAILLDDGRIRLVDRLKDIILVSGFNVYPNEVEDVLGRHEGVAEVAVVGCPDPRSGEAVIAHVVPRHLDVSEAGLRAYARERLTAYKVPKRIVFHDALPKSAVGKVLRRALREQERLPE